MAPSSIASKNLSSLSASRCIMIDTQSFISCEKKIRIFQTFVVTCLLLLNPKSASALVSRVASPRHQHPLSETPNAFLLVSTNINGHIKLQKNKLSLVRQFGSNNDDGNSMTRVSSAERNLGILVLCSVPLAWGTFEPAVRYVYAIKPAVPGFVFSVGFYLVAAVALSSLASLSMSRQDPSKKYGNETDVSSLLPIFGGVELGTYLFLGNALQVLGLKTVPSDRAAFLLQLTTIFVPLVQAIIAGNIQAIPLKTWGACFIALAGVAVMSLDSSDAGGANDLTNLVSLFTNLSQGDLLIVMAALAYTFHCIRLERYAKETSAIKLAACKATTETVWSLALVLLLVAFAASSTAGDDSGGILSYAFQEGTNIAEYVSTMFNQVSSGNLSLSTLTPAITAVLWTGLVTCAYTIYAQSFGQSRVNPTDANLIYTIQPLCTALFAWVLLGESLGPAGYIGGALIGSAVLIVATSDDDTNNRDDNDTFESLEHVNGDAAPVSMVHSPAEVELK